MQTQVKARERILKTMKYFVHDKRANVTEEDLYIDLDHINQLESQPCIANVVKSDMNVLQVKESNTGCIDY